jgi:Tol biopolymer transport system component
VNVQRYPDTTTSDPTSTELAWVSVEDKSFRILKTFEPWQSHYPERLSSDGRFIAYAAEPRPGSRDRYIYVLDAETQKETAVVTTAGSREAPVWTPDGTHLLFMENSVLKSVGVRDGQAVGEPRVVHSGMDGTLVGFTASGTIYFTQSVGGGNYHYIVPRSPSSVDRLLTFSGLSSAWSRDGRSMAFVRGNSLRELDLIVRDIESGEERSYRHEGIDVVSPRWMPDGSGVLVVVREQVDGKERASFQLVDLRTGNFRRLFDRDANGRSRTEIGTLSPDGKTLYVGVKASEDSPVTGIVAIDVATGAERQVATFSAAAGESGQFGVAVSPDGATLAVTTWTKPYAAARLFTVGVDGSNYREIFGPFDTGWIADTTRWTPDGRMLIFVAFDAKKNWRIMRVPAEGGQAQSDGLDFDTLTPLLGDVRMWPGNFNNIDVSPDGSRIVASSLTFSKYELWTLDGVLSFINSH